MQYSTSTMSWKNLNEDVQIPLKTELTFEKASNLKVVTIDTEKTWEFDIFIKDNDIPENSFIIVDIIIIFPTKGIKSIANCYHENKVLKCQALPKDFDSNYYYIYLLQIKDPNSNSTVTKWNNMEEIKAQVNIDTVNIFNLNYNFATKISEESGQKVFYIEILNNIPLENGRMVKLIF